MTKSIWRKNYRIWKKFEIHTCWQRLEKLRWRLPFPTFTLKHRRRRGNCRWFLDFQRLHFFRHGLVMAAGADQWTFGKSNDIRRLGSGIVTRTVFHVVQEGCAWSWNFCPILPFVIWLQIHFHSCLTLQWSPSQPISILRSTDGTQIIQVTKMKFPRLFFFIPLEEFSQ